MAIIPSPASLNSELQEIFRRLRNLESAPRGVTRTPESVSGTSGESLGFIDSTGLAQGVVRLSWAAPSIATDGTPLSPARYEVYGRQTIDSLGYPVNDPQWTLMDTVDHPTTTSEVGPFSSQSTWQFRVRAVSAKGQRSEFTYLTIKVALDGTVPPIPSTPLVSSSLRTVSMTWDGKDFSGATMPAAFALVEVHLSLTSGFTPDSTTLVDTLSGPGTIPRVQLAIGQVLYVKFRAKSRTGVLSEATPQAAVTVVGIVGPDMEFGSVTANEISTGFLSGAMIRGDVMTSSLGTGARFRLSGVDGLKLYNSANALTFWADATTGNTLVTGVFRTATSGLRIEINDALWSNYSGIRFYDGTTNGGMPEVKVGNATSGRAGQLQLSSGALIPNTSPSAQIELTVGGAWRIHNRDADIETTVWHDGDGQLSLTGHKTVFLSSVTGNVQINTASGTGNVFINSGTGSFIQLKGAKTDFVSPAGTITSSMQFSTGKITWETPGANVAWQGSGNMVLDFARAGSGSFAIQQQTGNVFEIGTGGGLRFTSDTVTFTKYITATTSNAPNLYANTAGATAKSSYVISARKYKRDFVPLADVLSVADVLAMQPVQYKMRPEFVADSDHPERVFFGFIADEAHKNPKLQPVLEYEHGDVERFQYEKWVGPQQVVLIDHERRINEQAAQIAELKAQLAPND